MEETSNTSSPTCSSGAGINCSGFDINLTEVMKGEPTETLSIVKAGNQFYAYFTPVILFVGLFGNVLSLLVFLSKNMRGMSASRYLAALSMADMATLVFYVFCEWLTRGLVYIEQGSKVTFLATEGVCQIWLYFNYLSRFLSAWITVCFTFERFVGVCMPFRRRHMGSLKGTMRIITTLVIVSAVLVSYKPFLSDVHTIHGETACTSRQRFLHEVFILDSIYALFITLIPFCIITVLNIMIIRRLYRRRRRHRDNLITEESHIRLEFTLILLAISFFFIAFNLPYFVVWFRTFIHSIVTDIESTGELGIDYWTGALSITRTIFYMNYCCNFFLYSITGAFFRREVVGLFQIHTSKYQQCRQQSNNTHETHVLNRNSWV